MLYFEVICNVVEEAAQTEWIVGLLHCNEGLDFEGYPFVRLVVMVYEVWRVMCRIFDYHFLDYVTGAALTLLGCQVLLIVLLDMGELWDDLEMPAATLEMAYEARAYEVRVKVSDVLLYL